MDNLDDDEDQSNSSDKSDEEIHESDADEKEFANEEMNESHRARKIPQKVQKLDLLLTSPYQQRCKVSWTNSISIIRNDTSDIFKPHI